MSSNTPVKRILILAANPKGTTQLRLDQEAREIESALERAKERDQFDIKTKSAVRTTDVRQAMLDFKPQIVHFSGHGAGDEGLLWENDLGQKHLVNAEALAGFFKLFANRVECVVLNACYSEIQAEAIAQYIDYVIGMSQAIGDRAAIEFAVSFYDALGAGESIEFAYKLGCNAIQMAGISEHLTPVIIKNSLKHEKKSLPNFTALNTECATHDKDIFLKSEKLMSERQLLNFLDQLEINHCFLEDQVRNIHDFCEFFEEESNRFIIEDLYHLSDELVEQLNSLSEFTVCNFFVFPETSSNLEGNTRFCMQPEMNIDRSSRHINAEKMLRYNELIEELYSHTNKVMNLYKKYRRFVKELLKI